ncbi:MAG: rhodanese-like domain-containing protein, partial [Stenotrophomonas chelatiphaga]
MRIPEISPELALQRLSEGAVLIDVREPHERAGGMAEGARGIALADLQAAPATHLPRLEQDILLICQTGKRSADAAQFLHAAGYAQVASVA